MNKELIFDFKQNISALDIPLALNNPFEVKIHAIARLAADEFKQFIALESNKWDYNFKTRNGKMFGILVVRKMNGDLGYLGTISGKISRQSTCKQFVPSVFDDATDNYFIDKGMTELSTIIAEQKTCPDPQKVAELKEKSRKKSVHLQNRLFENYHFSNILGKRKNLIEIFKSANDSLPPAAAGECAAPKLLQYALSNDLQPIAIAEFWWGNPITENGKTHGSFYPSCKDRCRPILEFMLNDHSLYQN